MYPITLPTTNAAIDLPTRWGELTLGQAARFAEVEDLDTYNVLSILLNLAPMEVMNLPLAFVNEQVLPVLEFLKDTMPDLGNQPLPKTITLPLGLCTLELPVPPALDIVIFGQATDLGALMKDLTKPVAEKRLRALAIVFYPSYTKAEYDSDAITDFAEQVCSRATLEQALPITDFFAEGDRIRREHASQLKRIPLDADERAAGFEALVEEWDTLAVVNALAAGDKTKWPYFFGLSWAEVNTMILYENHQAHYRYQLRKRQERK